MDLLPDDEQAAIAAAARDLVAASSPPGRLRALVNGEPVADAKLWDLAAQQGFFGLDVPEDLGGAGLTLAEQTLVFRELGRNLVPGPFLGTVVAARVAAAAGMAELVERIVSGSLPVGLLEPLGSGLARTFDADDAAAYVTVSSEGASVHSTTDVELVRRRPCVDAASRWAEVCLTGTPLAQVATSSFAALPYANVLVAAMLSGVCEATRDQSAAYAKIREQFGVPIGSFQAVKHRCADQAVRAEAAVQVVTLAALALVYERSDAALMWSAARSVAADHAHRNANDNVQNHGGIGYSSEHDAHLYVKRTQVLADLLLSERELRDAVLKAPEARPA